MGGRLGRLVDVFSPGDDVIGVDDVRGVQVLAEGGDVALLQAGLADGGVGEVVLRAKGVGESLGKGSEAVPPLMENEASRLLVPADVVQALSYFIDCFLPGDPPPGFGVTALLGISHDRIADAEGVVDLLEPRLAFGAQLVSGIGVLGVALQFDDALAPAFALRVGEEAIGNSALQAGCGGRRPYPAPDVRLTSPNEIGK